MRRRESEKESEREREGAEQCMSFFLKKTPKPKPYPSPATYALVSTSIPSDARKNSRCVPNLGMSPGGGGGAVNAADMSDLPL